MNDQTPEPTPPLNTPAPSGRLARVLTRLCVVAVVSVLSLAALAVTIPWVSYRYKHVVIGEAVVRGTVTRIGTRIEGRIKSIEVELGQHVSKGQVLFRLDDSHFKAEVERLRAQLQSATSDLESEKQAINQSRKRLTLEIKRVQGNRASKEGALIAQQSTLARLEVQYERIAGLIKTGAAAPSEMDRVAGDRDQSKALVQAANGDLDAADSSLEKAMNDLDGIEVRVSRLAVLNSQIVAAGAQLAGAEADLDASVIRAPEDGRVLERIVEVGGSAKVGEPMLKLWIGWAWMEAWVDERDLRKFKIGSAAEISLDASPARKLSGRVEAIGLESDKELQPLAVPPTLHSFLRLNAMVPVRIALEEDNSRIQLGLSAVVGISKDQAAPETNRPHIAQDSAPHNAQIASPK